MVNSGESVAGIMPGNIALLSEQHQNWLAEQGLRTLQGSFYTPFDVVESLIEISASTRFKQITNLGNTPKIIDPACGTGNFLVISALRIVDRLVALGIDAAYAMQFVVRNCVYGTDVDESALIKCAINLSDLTGGTVKPLEIRQHFLCRDALLIDGAGTSTKSQPSFLMWKMKNGQTYFHQYLFQIIQDSTS